MPKHTLTFSAEADVGLKLTTMFVAWLALRDDVEDVKTTLGEKPPKAAAPAPADDEEEAPAKPAKKAAKAAAPAEEEADPLDELAADDNEEKDAMMASLSKLAKLTKKEGVKKILARLKVAAVDDIPEEKYAAVTAAADKMIAEVEGEE